MARKRDQMKFDARAFYDKEGLVARRYDSTNFWERRYHRKKAELIYFALKSKTPTNNMVLDAGCGSGELSKTLYQAGSDVISLDISKSYLNRLKGIVHHRICASIENLPFRDHAFNIVLCSDVIEHLQTYDEPINELFRVTAGSAIISTPCNGLTRRLFEKLFPKRLEYLDAKVGHLNIWTLTEFKQNLRRPNLTLTCRSYHVFQPILNEHFFPRKLAPLIILAERIGATFAPNCGTISVALVTPKYFSNG